MLNPEMGLSLNIPETWRPQFSFSKKDAVLGFGLTILNSALATVIAALIINNARYANSEVIQYFQMRTQPEYLAPNEVIKRYREYILPVSAAYAGLFGLACGFVHSRKRPEDIV